MSVAGDNVVFLSDASQDGEACAWLCASVGEKDQALGGARAARDPSMGWPRMMWPLLPLCSDPRATELLRRLGLADEPVR